MERDKEFANSLPALLPLFFGDSIRSLDAAKAARDQLLAIDLTKLRVGIPMNRLSEDVFHGKEHASIADWLPDVPTSIDLPFGLQDAYLVDPSEKNYEALDAALVRQQFQQKTVAQDCSLNKRRAVLYFAQQLRAAYSKDDLPKPPAGNNPMWNLGEFGRSFASEAIGNFGMPKDIVAKKLDGPSSADQMKELRLAWYWLGWTMDPGLQRSGESIQTKQADYFTRFLWLDGPYPTHEAFMITRKIASESFVPSAWNSRTPQHLDLNYSGLTNDKDFAGTLPHEAQHRQLFSAFVRNSFRMNLYLLIDELPRTKTVYLRQALLQQLNRMKILSTDAEDIALVDQAKRLIAEAKDAKIDLRGGRASG